MERSIIDLLPRNRSRGDDGRAGDGDARAMLGIRWRMLHGQHFQLYYDRLMTLAPRVDEARRDA